MEDGPRGYRELIMADITVVRRAVGNCGRRLRPVLLDPGRRSVLRHYKGRWGKAEGEDMV